jgi:hypothetical protein
MRVRLGRTVRLVIALAFLILMIPFLMFKLESANKQSIPEHNEVDYPEVNIGYLFFDCIFYSLFRRKRLLKLLKQLENN